MALVRPGTEVEHPVAGPQAVASVGASGDGEGSHGHGATVGDVVGYLRSAVPGHHDEPWERAGDARTPIQDRGGAGTVWGRHGVMDTRHEAVCAEGMSGVMTVAGATAVIVGRPLRRPRRRSWMLPDPAAASRDLVRPHVEPSTEPDRLAGGHGTGIRTRKGW
jgi:hypothetical protein